MRVTVYSSFEELASIRAAWNRLNESSETPTLFQTFEWNQAWWKVFGDSTRGLKVIVAQDDNGLCGVAPLCLREDQLEFIGTENFFTDYSNLVFESGRVEVKQRLIKETLSIADQGYDFNWWNYVTSVPKAEESVTFVRRSRKSVLRQINLAPRLVLGPGAIEQIENKKSYKRARNSLQKLGRLDAQIFHQEDEILERLDTLFDLHTKRWSETRTPGIFDPRGSDHSAKNREFFREITKALATRKVIHLFEVKLDARVIAVHFGFEFGEEMLWYKPAFDPEFAKFSPGEVMLVELIKEAASRAFRVFDFTIGNEGFKSRYSSETRPVYQILSPKSFLGYVTIAAKGSLKALLKRSKRG